MIAIKRVYEKAEKGDGFRVLVDRLWPRGLRKEDARIDLWLKEVAPSDALRKWYAHDPEKWPEFRKRYFAELEGKRDAAAQLREGAERGAMTLLYASKEERLNNAAALREFLIRLPPSVPREGPRPASARARAQTFATVKP